MSLGEIVSNTLCGGGGVALGRSDLIVVIIRGIRLA